MLRIARCLAMSSILCLPFGIQVRAENIAPQTTEAQIAAWIKQLGDDTFDTRINAEKNLLATGKAATKEQLEKASAGNDAAIKTRAAIVLNEFDAEPILQKIQNVRSRNMEGDVTTISKIMNMKWEIKGHFKSMADKRYSMTDVNDNSQGVEATIHRVMDGKTEWSEITLARKGANASKTVRKMSLNTIHELGGQGVAGGPTQTPAENAEQMRKNFVFTNVTGGKLEDGGEVYVLDGVLREGAADAQIRKAQEIGGPMAARMIKQRFQSISIVKIFIDKTDMFARKIDVFDVQGNLVTSATLSNVKFDTAMEEKDFAYTPPNEATVVDVEEQWKAARDIHPKGAENQSEQRR